MSMNLYSAEIPLLTPTSFPIELCDAPDMAGRYSLGQ